MNLHEYQGKDLFSDYNLPVSKRKVVFNANDVIEACDEIGGSKWVVKAQVHAGGRGKAGGVKLIETPEEGVKFAKKWLGSNLITYQTDKKDNQLMQFLLKNAQILKKNYI
mgnify:CR=1 FL=1